MLTRDELQELELQKQHRIAIDSLIRSEGWKLFSESMRQAADVAYQQMITEKQAHPAAVAMGVNHALRSMLDWPKRTLAAIEAASNQITEARR